MITSKVERIGPKEAAAMLAMNDGNRPMQLRRVREFVGWMETGRFKNNGESIKVAADGWLLDGQHRLAAVVESGLTIDVVVTRGLDRDVFSTLDRPRVRSSADVLAMEGVASAKNLAAALTAVRGLSQGSGNYGTTPFVAPQPDEISGLLAEHPMVVESHRKSRPKSVPFRYPVSVLAGIHCLASEAGFASEADEFVERLFSGVARTTTDPVLVLREQFIGKSQATNRVPTTGVQSAWMIKAWGAYLRGEQARFFRVRLAPTAEPYPRLYLGRSA